MLVVDLLLLLPTYHYYIAAFKISLPTHIWDQDTGVRSILKKKWKRVILKEVTRLRYPISRIWGKIELIVLFYFIFSLLIYLYIYLYVYISL